MLYPLRATAWRTASTEMDSLPTRATSAAKEETTKHTKLVRKGSRPEVKQIRVNDSRPRPRSKGSNAEVRTCLRLLLHLCLFVCIRGSSKARELRRVAVGIGEPDDNILKL